MAIIEDKCRQCGTEVIVRTGNDCKVSFRKDNKQTIYKTEPVDSNGREYDIFRCEGCGLPIHETVQAAAYDEGTKINPVVEARKKQLIKLINVGKSTLALDNDTYRSMLIGAVKKDSLRTMVIGELEQVLDLLKSKGFKPQSKSNKTAVKRRLSPAAGKSKLASIDKIRAIWITMGHHLVIQDNSESALDAYVRRMTLRSRITNNQTQGVDATPWMTEPQAYKVLESLKNWHKRVLIERIIARGERLKMNEKGTRPASYDEIVAQYEGHGRSALPTDLEVSK